MNRRMVTAVVIGLVVAFLAWLSLRQSQAQGQIQEEKQAWEYKVVAFVVNDQNSRNADQHTKQINSLAAEGWEYVGLLASGPNPYHTGGPGWVGSGGNVLFKRPKK